MESRVAVYRRLFEHEVASTTRMLGMIASVPEARRSDPQYQRAVTLAAHLAACRTNWLDRMIGAGLNQVPWWEDDAEASKLESRFASVQVAWTDFFASLNDAGLDLDFDFPIRDGNRYRWNIEGQILQLIGHGNYHRGQVALLVDMLGGETVDTDYLYWATEESDRWGFVT